MHGCVLRVNSLRFMEEDSTKHKELMYVFIKTGSLRTLQKNLKKIKYAILFITVMYNKENL